MNRIRHIDEEARLAVAEAGVILETFHNDVLAHGLRFPLTLGGKGSATIGGIVSTNAGGTQGLGHGTTRADRKSVVWGKSVSVLVVPVGSSTMKKKKIIHITHYHADL